MTLASSSGFALAAWNHLPHVEARLGYLAPGDGPVEVRVYPPNSSLRNVRPESAPRQVPIYDGRSVATMLRLDEQGFELHAHRTGFTDYYDVAAVQARYYPEVREVMRSLTGALDVIVFDHNVRSAVRAARGEPGVREPVDQVHNDYTIESGPKRKQQILEAAGRSELARQRVAFVNLWRPIVGPVLDNPLTVCDARSVAPSDLVPTAIQHFGEDNLSVPRHRGEIYSVRHAPAHRWIYFTAMRPDEVLLLKGYDSLADGRARFVPHTGFNHPECPPDAIPRESIEARTLVVFDERL
jgi:hypothetical protein